MYQIKRLRDGLFKITNAYGETLDYAESYLEARVVINRLRNTHKVKV